MMESAIRELEEKGRVARAAARKLAFTSTATKNRALTNIAESIIARQDEILAANKIDLEYAESSGIDRSMLDRIMLSTSRLEAISGGVRKIVALPDPVGEIYDMHTAENGLQIGRKRVPLGVIGAIYESRPNVTIDISTLCLKAGNAVILRSGKESINSSVALANIAQEACDQAGLAAGAIQIIESTDHNLVNHMLKMRGMIDLMIPRGGAGLIKIVRENATMSVIAGGIGVCHTYVDRDADLDKAVSIVHNAKVQRPSVCNALDCILIHVKVAKTYLPIIATKLAKDKVELHCDEKSMDILKSIPSLDLVKAVEEDWGKEYLSLKASIKVVSSLDEALAHIEKYGSGHSEAIISENYSSAMRFINEVDAASVYANASTRFTDGEVFGLGAEIGISTQKFHARGPMGLKEVTSYKWIIFGDGQILS
jgi:glutamate-5-semialdehyde dehydrogenase